MKNAVGKATAKAIIKDLIHIKIKLLTNPKFIKIKTPDIIKAIIKAIKKGKRMRGFCINFFIIFLKYLCFKNYPRGLLFLSNAFNPMK